MRPRDLVVRVVTLIASLLVLAWLYQRTPAGSTSHNLARFMIATAVYMLASDLFRLRKRVRPRTAPMS